MTCSSITSGLLLVAWLLTAKSVYGIQQLRGLGNTNDGAQRTSSEEMLENALVNNIAYLYKDNSYISQVSSFTDEESGTSYGIPKDFVLEDSLLLLSDEPKYQPFPRWHHQMNGYEGTMMEALVDFVHATSVSYNTSNSNKDATLTDHKDDFLHETPEVFYILRSNGVYIAQSTFDAYSRFGEHLTIKTDAVHSMMRRSYDTLVSDETSSLAWPKLFQLLVNEKRDVPFLMWYADYTGCNLHNWRNNQSVPVFTMAANVDCHHSFPIPTYETYEDSVDLKQEQQSSSNTINASTWKGKNATVMWRGGLTGQRNHGSIPGMRYQLLKYINSNELSTQERHLFDMRPTYLDSILERNEDEWPSLGFRGFKVDQLPGDVQESYRAILDVDGHSWSARFGKLLGKHSVVLKIEPQEVDYFHFKRSKDDSNKRVLEPWKHYIPVKRDLSDLVAKAKYALSDANADHIVQIISNANEWYRTNMVKDVVANDLLDVWESYITKLDENSPGWMDLWEKNQHAIMTDASLKMTLLHEFV